MNDYVAASRHRQTPTNFPSTKHESLPTVTKNHRNRPHSWTQRERKGRENYRICIGLRETSKTNRWRHGENAMTFSRLGTVLLASSSNFKVRYNSQNYSPMYHAVCLCWKKNRVKFFCQFSFKVFRKLIIKLIIYFSLCALFQLLLIFKRRILFLSWFLSMIFEKNFLQRNLTNLIFSSSNSINENDLKLLVVINK